MSVTRRCMLGAAIAAPAGVAGAIEAAAAVEAPEPTHFAVISSGAWFRIAIWRTDDGQTHMQIMATEEDCEKAKAVNRRVVELGGHTTKPGWT